MTEDRFMAGFVQGFGMGALLAATITMLHGGGAGTLIVTVSIIMVFLGVSVEKMVEWSQQSK